MNHNIYAIYDIAAENTLTPLMVAPNDVNPVRQFTELVNNKESILNRHAKDYALIKIGVIDMTSGIIRQAEFRETVITGLDAQAETK